jgi:ankyrin repeat and IBR domain-containing protein 1
MQKGSRDLDAGGKGASSTAFTCCVCYQSFHPTEENVVLPCGHSSTCARCWGLYVMSRLDEGNAAQIQCTEPGCSMPVPLGEAKKVVPARWCVCHLHVMHVLSQRSQQGLQMMLQVCHMDVTYLLACQLTGRFLCSYPRLQRQVLNSYVDSNPHIKWCPRPGCGCSISLSQQVKERNVTVEAIKRSGPLTVRCACGYAFCWHCLDAAHEPASCEQVRSSDLARCVADLCW